MQGRSDLFGTFLFMVFDCLRTFDLRDHLGLGVVTVGQNYHDLSLYFLHEKVGITFLKLQSIDFDLLCLVGVNDSSK